MSPKHIILVGTMAFVITVSVFRSETTANAYVSIVPLDRSSAPQTHLAAHHKKRFVKGDFLQLLGVSSEEEVRDALYDGKSLAAIAESNDKDVQALINLQVAELTEQLDQRLADGSLSPEDYEAQKAELPELITQSTYGRMNT